jgi:hypothetical protein
MIPDVVAVAEEVDLYIAGGRPKGDTVQ